MSVIGSITIYRSTVSAAIQAEPFLQGVLSMIKKLDIFVMSSGLTVIFPC